MDQMQQLIELCKTSQEANRAAQLMCELIQRNDRLDPWGKSVVSLLFTPLFKIEQARSLSLESIQKLDKEWQQ